MEDMATKKIFRKTANTKMFSKVASKKLSNWKIKLLNLLNFIETFNGKTTQNRSSKNSKKQRHDSKTP